MKRSQAIQVTASEALERALPALPEAVRETMLARTEERTIRYPIGSGQGNELALRAGLRPMMRELIHLEELPAAIARAEAAGFVCELSPLVFGSTHDGWLKRPPAPGRGEDRSPLYVGRDRGALRAAIASELAKTDEGARELGRLLGYPPCCVEAFVGVSRERRAHELWASAWARTTGRPAPRLDVLDLAIFAFVPWYPCAFDCPPSQRFAGALGALVSRLHSDFAAAVDRAHAQHRLVLAPEVQLSIDGAWETDRVVDVTSVRATACDRDPRARFAPEERALVARALAWLSGARTLAVEGRRVVVDGVAHDLGLPAPLPLLVPFGRWS
jgi:hypothetical protein